MVVVAPTSGHVFSELACMIPWRYTQVSSPTDRGIPFLPKRGDQEASRTSSHKAVPPWSLMHLKFDIVLKWYTFIGGLLLGLFVWGLTVKWGGVIIRYVSGV